MQKQRHNVTIGFIEIKIHEIHCGNLISQRSSFQHVIYKIYYKNQLLCPYTKSTSYNYKENFSSVTIKRFLVLETLDSNTGFR